MAYLQLLVGSDDYDIRVFKSDEMVVEISEVEVSSNTWNIAPCPSLPRTCFPVSSVVFIFEKA